MEYTQEFHNTGKSDIFWAVGERQGNTKVIEACPNPTPAGGCSTIKFELDLSPFQGDKAP